MLRSSLVVFGFLAQTLVIVWLLNPEVGVPGCAEPMMARPTVLDPTTTTDPWLSYTTGGKDELVIVTAASENHFDVLKRSLLQTIYIYEPDTRVIIYDLGLSLASRRELEQLCGERGVWSVRTFDYSRYPSYMSITIARGEYAWKPIIIKEVVDQFPLVLWLDAGDGLTDTLDPTKEFIKENGFLSLPTTGTLWQWTHPGMIAYFKEHYQLTDAMLYQHLNNCDGATNGWSRYSPVYEKMLVPWQKCALVKECIAPPGSDRSNHRQDQAALTLLALMNGFRCGAIPFTPPTTVHNDNPR